jgi:hypothetical protein
MKKISILLCVMAVGLFAVRANVTMPPNANINTGPALPFNGYRSSPGTEVGVTDYDWMQNGSMGRYVWVTPSGGYSFYWTYRYGGSNANRRAYYNYYYPPSYWLGPTAMDTRQSRMGAMDQMTDGRALGAAHATNAVNNTEVTLYLDAAEGAGTFTLIHPAWLGDPATEPSWPKPLVDINDNIFVAASQNGGPYSYWNRSTDEGASWLGWDSTMGGVELDLINYDYGGHECWAHSTTTPWISLVNDMGDAYYTIVYWETGNNGALWYYDTAFAAPDSVQGYIWHSAIYDNNEYVHIVFTCIDTLGGAGASGSGWRSQIRHFNQETGQISIVDGGMGWVESNPGPGSNHPTVSEPQIAIDRATGDLYCTWCYADPSDVAANGLVNMDIWGAKSTDNGATWIERHNITNSPTPGATAGNCDNDHVNTLAEETLGDTLVMFYLNDKDAGNAAYPPDPGATLTDSPLLFYLYAWVGIEENNTQEPRRLTLNVAPNPFRNNTVISYALPTAGNVSIKLYGIDGRLVENVYNGRRDAGVYTANVDARQLANGTYFVVLETANEKVTSSLVVVR